MIEELITVVNQIGQPGQLADFINYGPMFTFEDKIVTLEALDPLERLRKVQRKLEV